MAEEQSFDAKVPAMQDSNWLFYSKAGQEQPKGSSANKIMNTAIGHSLEKGAELFDKLQEDNVRNTVFDVEQRDRMQFINSAQQIATDKGVDHTKDILGQATDGPSMANAPAQVKQTVSRVQTVQAASDAGKVDKYGYFQRVIPDLQAVRQQYPGYRHVVDAALGNNANAEMNTLIQEINRKDSEAREDKRRDLTQAESLNKEGLLGPNGTVAVEALRAGKTNISTVMKMAAPFISDNYYAKAAKQNRDVFEWNQIRKTEQYTKDLQRQTKSIADGGVIWPSVYAGKSGPSTDEDIAAIKGMEVSGKVDPVEAQARAVRLEAHYNEAHSAALAKANETYADGSSQMSVLGPEKVEANIKAQLSGLRAWIDSVSDPKTHSLSEVVKNNIVYTQQNDEWAKMTDPKFQQFLRNFHVIKQEIGEQGASMAIASMPNFAGNVRSVMESDAVNVFGGRPDDKGNLPTIGDQTKTMLDLGIKDPNAYKGKVQMINMVTDKDVPDDRKKKVAQAFFAATQGNRDFIANFNSGYYEGGRWHDGAEEILRGLTDPKVTKQIVKFGDAKLATDYQNTVDTWFKVLAQRNIQTLNGALTTEVAPQTINRATGQRIPNKVPPIKLTWDTEANQPDVTPEARRYLMMTRQRGVLDSITRLQRFTGNMGHILETLNEAGYPRDMRTYMRTLLQSEGLNIEDLPASKELVKAIEATAPKTKQDTLGAM